MPRRTMRWRLTSAPSKGRLRARVDAADVAPTGQRRPSRSRRRRRRCCALRRRPAPGRADRARARGACRRASGRRAWRPGAPRRRGRAGRRAQLAAKRGDVLVQLAVDEVAAVGRELVRRRRRGQSVLLVGVAEEELAGAHGPPAPRRSGRPVRAWAQAGALDRRLGEAVGEAEVLGPSGSAAPKCSTTMVMPSRHRGAQARPRERRAPRVLALSITSRWTPGVRSRPPMLGGARAAVAEQVGPGRHAGAELLREAGERGARKPERASPV